MLWSPDPSLQTGTAQVQGHDAAHTKTEAAWVAAFEKAKSQKTYLALASTTGLGEVWFVEPFETFSALGKARDMSTANAALAAELGLIAPADAAHVDAVRTIEAVGRPDLSHGAYPNLNLQRHWEITVFRVRAGFEPMFADVARSLTSADGSPAGGRARPRAGPDDPPRGRSACPARMVAQRECGSAPRSRLGCWRARGARRRKRTGSSASDPPKDGAPWSARSPVRRALDRFVCAKFPCVMHHTSRA